MDYNPISSFLDKFKKIVFEDRYIKKTIALALTKHLTVPIDERMVKIRGAIIYIEGSPIIKSEVFMHKAGIMNDISALIHNRKFTDIR